MTPTTIDADMIDMTETLDSFCSRTVSNVLFLCCAPQVELMSI